MSIHITPQCPFCKNPLEGWTQPQERSAMTKEQAVAYINAMTACANAEVAGMQALNTYRGRRGETMAYNDAAFLSIPEKWGIHHSAVLTLFQECEP